MSKDITTILSGWDYDPESELQVRIVAGDDGLEKLQMRVDLGVLQLELNGRPDGTRPCGFESLLDFHQDRASDVGPTYRLNPSVCLELMREGVQYYHRYVALFHLKRYDLVARDTARNLRLFAFAVTHAERPADRLRFNRYRPYVTMMHARALGLQAIERDDHRTAIEQIDRSIRAIENFLGEQDQGESCAELEFLQQWRREVERDRKIGPVERLEQQLALAVSLEQYEEAARLRDQIHRLRPPAGRRRSTIPDEPA